MPAPAAHLVRARSLALRAFCLALVARHPMLQAPRRQIKGVPLGTVHIFFIKELSNSLVARGQ